MKELLFSVTKDDFSFDFFRAGGKGGQKQNKTSSGCRCTHKESGAVGEGRDERSQPQNKKNAFMRCTDSPKFKAWLRMRIAECCCGETLEQKVEKQMNPHNLLVETKDDDGKWVLINKEAA